MPVAAGLGSDAHRRTFQRSLCPDPVTARRPSAPFGPVSWAHVSVVISAFGVVVSLPLRALPRDAACDTLKRIFTQALTVQPSASPKVVPLACLRKTRAVSTSRAAATYASALNRNELFESPGLRRDIPGLLRPAEEVLLVLPGVAGDFPNVMIVTATRFLLASVAGPLKKAKIKREVASFEVTGVRYRPGIFTRVRVARSSGRNITMVPNRKVDAERFAAELAHLIQTGSLPS